MAQRMRNSRNELNEELELNGKGKKKKKVNKLVIIIFLAIVVLLSSFVIYAYFSKTFFFADEGELKIEESIFQLDEFVLNLKDESGRRYIKATIVLSYEDSKNLSIFVENTPQIRDQIISIIREKTSEEMMDIELTNELKQELKESVNILLEESMVLDVYFIDFLIQ